MFIKQANTSEEITKIKLLQIKNITPSQLENKHHFKNKLIQFNRGSRLLWNVDKFLLDQMTSVLYTYGFKNIKFHMFVWTEYVKFYIAQYREHTSKFYIAYFFYVKHV